MTDIGLGHYLTLSGVIFTIGIAGVFLNRKNIIVILMSIELILLAVNINFVSFSIFLNDLVGQIFTLFSNKFGNFVGQIFPLFSNKFGIFFVKFF